MKYSYAKPDDAEINGCDDSNYKKKKEEEKSSPKENADDANNHYSNRHKGNISEANG